MTSGSFKLILTNDYHAMSEAAAHHIATQIQRKPDLLLCLATGSSPRKTYQFLADCCQSGAVPSDRLRMLKLDEWGGVPMDDPCTCESYLRHHLLLPLAIRPDQYQGFVSDSADPAAECRRITDWLAAAGPIDLCILGLGVNGHLGLNEPAAGLCPDAHVAQLTSSTLAHPMLTETGRTVTFGLTLGIAQIMRSRQILLLVNGQHKAQPMRQLMEARVTTQFPASMLWMHPNVVCVCDQEAGLLVESTWVAGSLRKPQP